MNPACPKCDSTSTRRKARTKSFTDKVMYFFGTYPWECLTCQENFFSKTRYSRSKRHASGEVYTGTETKPTVRPGSEESRPR